MRSGRAASHVAAGVFTRLSAFRMRRLGSECAAHVLAPKALAGAHLPSTMRAWPCEAFLLREELKGSRGASGATVVAVS